MNEQVSLLAADLAALDRAITIRDPKLNSNLIGQVNGWQGRYGTRGALRQVILTVLNARAPEWLSTRDIGDCVTTELGLVFEFPSERLQWNENTLRRALNALLKKATVKREVGPPTGSSAMGRWRWKQAEVVTLADLREAL